MNVEEKIAHVRASTPSHNATYRRKLRKLYQQSPKVMVIIEKEIENGNQTIHEFEVTNVGTIKRLDNNTPYLYNVEWANSINTPDTFIGCEGTLRKFVPEYKNKTDLEIRDELINQYNFNKSLEEAISDKEYEDIIIPKIRKN